MKSHHVLTTAGFFFYHLHPASGKFKDSCDRMRAKKRASADQLAGEHKALHAPCHGNIQHTHQNTNAITLLRVIPTITCQDMSGRILVHIIS